MRKQQKIEKQLMILIPIEFFANRFLSIANNENNVVDDFYEYV